MILGRCFLTSALVALMVLGGRASGRAGDDPPADRLAEACRQHGLDPEAPLEGRIKDPTEAVFDVVNHFRRIEVSPRVARPPVGPPAGTVTGLAWNGPVMTRSELKKLREEAQKRFSRPPLGPAPTPHALTDAERGQLKAAVGALPPGFRRVLMRRMRSFQFVDHMVVGGTVVIANPGEAEPLHDIAISATVFGQTASEWLTAKEQGVFVPGASAVRVRIEVGPDLPALTYVLLHEAAHLVDGVERITDAPPPYPPNLQTALRIPQRRFAPLSNPFRAGVWGDNSAVEPRYADPRRAAIEFYAAAGAVSADEIPAIYAALAATPFVSLYSTRNPMEDFAEYATVAHLTEAMGLTYRVILHVEGIEILADEPMHSDLVRSRLGLMRRFYADPL